MKIIKRDEYNLNDSERSQLKKVLKSSFPNCLDNRIYFKQLPHFRLLGSIDGQIIAQVVIDYRVISLNGKPKNIFGIIDLCVDSNERRKGLAERLMNEIERLAKKSEVDYIVLFADDYRLYKRLGYKNVSSTCKYLGIEEHKTVGILENDLSDCMMIKEVGTSYWEEGNVDMLGYVF